MKHLFTILFFLCAFFLLCGSSCKKSKNSSPIDQLPPETQIGANTFGCLVDGKVFVPKGLGLSPRLTCYYQYIYFPHENGYVFQVAANDKSMPSVLNSLNIGFDSMKVMEGKTYLLQKVYKGGARGNYRHFTETSLDDFFTYSPSSGELVITKFDEANQIVSGTFWFNAINNNGDTVYVTDGRFDMQFTK